MRVTFDSNVWEKVVAPDAYPDDPQNGAFRTVHQAIRAKRLQGFISETFATLEAIPKGKRSVYLAKRQQDMFHTEWLPSDGNGAIRGRITVGGSNAAHPGLHPTPALRLQQALDMGFLILPTSRMGTVRPPQIDDPRYRIALTEAQHNDIWKFLDELAGITESIEFRGVGRSIIKDLARRIQQRLGLASDVWYSGLEQSVDSTERKAVDRAFAEWADGDTVALHIAYGLDILCTEDRGRSAIRSVFDVETREWLGEQYSVRFMGIQGLADAVG